MRLVFVLPGVRRKDITPPSLCSYEDCQGRRFRVHQQVAKPLNDTVYPRVAAYRYQCLTCGRTFRVYPKGVSSAQTSLRVKRLAVILYYLGLSYGAASVALQAFGVYISKSQVYGAVQEMAKAWPELSRRAILERVRTPVPGSDLVYAKSDDEWLSLELSVNDGAGTFLAVGQFPTEDAETLVTSIAPIAQAVGAEILLSDGEDLFKRAADSLELEARPRQDHLQRETHGAAEQVSEAV